jgi:hypothetical protein
VVRGGESEPAEVAMAVAGAWQGGGLPRQLLQREGSMGTDAGAAGLHRWLGQGLSVIRVLQAP